MLGSVLELMYVATRVDVLTFLATEDNNIKCTEKIAIVGMQSWIMK